MAEIKTQDVLSSFELKLYENIKELAPFYQQLEPFEMDRLKLHALIVKLSHRDKTLAKLVYLKSSAWFSAFDGKNPRDFIAKRGKKETQHVPLKAIMQALKCSHRTAQAYLLTLRGLELSDRLSVEALEFIALHKSKEGS